MDFRKRQQRPYTPLMISGTHVERVSSFKYLGVNISEDLTWTAHIQTQVKKARQRLYHLRQLRKFRVSPAILETFYSGAIECVLTQCISVWYGNAFNQDCKALQRVVHLVEHISGSGLPSLQDIYLKRCKSRAAKIIKDSNHQLFHMGKNDIPAIRKDGYVEVCVLEIYRDKPILGSDLWHDFLKVNILNLSCMTESFRTRRSKMGRNPPSFFGTMKYQL